MCLDSIIARYYNDKSKSTVYKVLEIERGRLLSPYKFFVFKPNKWHKKSDEIELYIDNKNQYVSGFHSYVQYEHALSLAEQLTDEGFRVAVYEATAKELMYLGIQDDSGVVVSRYLKINRRIK